MHKLTKQWKRKTKPADWLCRKVAAYYRACSRDLSVNCLQLTTWVRHRVYADASDPESCRLAGCRQHHYHYHHMVHSTASDLTMTQTLHCHRQACPSTSAWYSSCLQHANSFQHPQYSANIIIMYVVQYLMYTQMLIYASIGYCTNTTQELTTAKRKDIERKNRSVWAKPAAKTKAA